MDYYLKSGYKNRYYIYFLKPGDKKKKILKSIFLKLLTTVKCKRKYLSQIDHVKIVKCVALPLYHCMPSKVLSSQ